MNRRALVANIVAVILPVALLLAGFQHLARPDTGLLDTRAEGIRQKLAKASPTIAVVGNSLARDDVDAKRLAKALGQAGHPAQVVTKLAVGGTPPPVWYAMLKHHVFGNDHAPDVVLVVGTLESFFWSHVSTVGETQRLRELVGTNDAEILQKATGRQVVIPAVERAATRKVALRDEVLESWAERVVALAGVGSSDTDEDAPTAARRSIDDAFTSLFETDGAIDLELHKRVIPVMQESSELAHQEARLPLSDTFLPLFQQLVADKGARLVFVRVPVLSGSASEAEMGRAEELISWANDHDVGVVDLSGLPVENRHFRDGKHLNKRGRALFTDALAEALDGLGVFGQGPLEEARIPLAPPTISRAADPPMLAPVQPSDLQPMEGCVRSVKRADLAPYGAGSLARKRLWNASPLRYRLDGELQALKPGRIVKSTCSGVALNGDRLLVAGMSGPIELVLAPGAPLALEGKRNVHWVYPGSPLLVTLGEERRAALQAAGGPFAFDVVVQPLRQGAAPVVVSFDDGPPEALATRRGRLVESVFEVGGLPERVSVASDEPAVVRLIRIRAPSETEVLVGELDRAGESVVRMFEGGKTPTRFGRPPPSLDSVAPTRAGDEWVWRVPHLKHINNSAVFRASDKYNCSPVRVVHGGDVQDFSYASCNAMKPGTICFDGPAVRIRPVQPIDASDFRLGLDSSRQCRTWTFLYGGDSLTHELDDAALSRLLAGVEQLELMAEVLPSASATLKDEHWTVSLHSSKGRLVKRRLAVRDFAASIQRFRLNKGRGQDGLKFAIEADEGAPPIIVGYALLHERVRPRVVPSTDDIQSLKQRIQQVRLKRKPASDESGGGAP